MRTADHRSVRRGFTLIELAATAALAAALSATAIIATGTQPTGSTGTGAGGLASARQAARTKKDETQVRAIGQAMIVWAQNNGDVYPFPSRIDRENLTVKDDGRAKNTTANIYSVMVYNGSLSPEILVSPLEKNSSISACKTYEYDAPKTAVKPAMALWDPAFTVGLTPEAKGNASYAHLQPAGNRLNRWKNDFSKGEVVVCTRGPEILSVKMDGDGHPIPTFAKPDSLTLTMLGDGTAWAGHVVFNDNHTELFKTTIAHQKPYTGKATYSDADGKTHPDLMFWDEPEDPLHVNNFFGLFTKAGEKPAAFKGVWD
jgi:prepilin-type N-terminal cleavage/methylation domain-containing protein